MDEKKIEKQETWGEWARSWIAFGKKAANTALGDKTHKKVGTAVALVGTGSAIKGALQGDFVEAGLGALTAAGGVGLRVFGHKLFEPELPTVVLPPKVELKDGEETLVAEELGISVNQLAEYKNLLDAKADELAKKVKLNYTDLLERNSRGQLNGKDRTQLKLLQTLAACEINKAREALAS